MVRAFLGFLFFLLMLGCLSGEKAVAAIVSYTDKATFISNLAVTPIVEGFESLPVTNTEFSTTSVILPHFTLNSGVTFGVFNLADYFGTYATGGSKYLVTTYAGASTSWLMTFTFHTPLSAFGLDVTDFGDNPPSSLKLLVGSQTLNIATSTRPNGNLLFYGIQGVGETFQTVHLQVQGDPIGLDEVHFVFVPEPSITMQLLLGMSALLMRRRRRASLPDSEAAKPPPASAH